MIKYFLLGFMNAAFLALGLWLGIVITELRLAQTPQIVYREVLPSPAVYWEGKRSESGALSPETIRAIEIETAKKHFENGNTRDPFERLR